MNSPKTRSASPMYLYLPFALIMLMLATVAGVAMAGGGYGHRAAQKDIVGTAVSAGSFTTLVTAIQQAGLVDTLKGPGPFTVFAPTDEAFAKIPPEQLNALLADKEALVKVLTYHVVPGRVTADQVAGMSSATTVQGQSVSVDTSDGVRVNNARVIQADILASNGVIHVIDSVLLPQ